MNVVMSWKRALFGGVAALVVAGAAAGALYGAQGKPAAKGQGKPAPKAAAAAPVMTVYKTPTCGCCKSWVEHVQAHGYRVAVRDTADVGPVKAMLGVPRQLGSCHTAVIGGYVVEGHVPAELIDKLLRERPRIAGIAVPGMPVGSPGMEVPGRTPDHYDVLSFDRAGKVAVYARR